MAHAARCLGPINLGISAQVQLLSQQLALGFNGGIDSIGLRLIARDRAEALPTLTTALNFRLGLALLLSMGWLLVSMILFEPGPRRNAWLLGIPLLLIASLNTTFVYQGLGRLPLYTAIISVGSITTSGIYLLFFTPGIAVGSDLMVSSVVSGLAAVAALIACNRYLLDRGWFSSLLTQPIKLAAIKALLADGWRYWLLAVVVYLYSAFPLLLVSYFHGDAAAGVFRAAFLMAIALELLFGSINSLLLPKLVGWHKEGLGVLWARQTDLLRLHLVIGISAGLVAVAVATVVFDRFMGRQFSESVGLFQVLVVGRVIVFVGQIYAFGLIALQLDSNFLRSTLGGAIFSLVANLALIPKFGALAAALVSVLVELVICTQYFFLERRHVTAHSGQQG
jgi:PST family polysaccharide transporter